MLDWQVFFVLFFPVEGIWPGLYDMMFWGQTCSTYATTYGRMAWDYLFFFFFFLRYHLKFWK